MKRGISPVMESKAGMDSLISKTSSSHISSSSAGNSFNQNTDYKVLYVLTILIILLSLVASGIGLFDRTDGLTHNFINQYGDVVKIYGKGLYKHDSYFRAPIFRGTDFTMFFIASPLLIVSLLLHIKKPTVKAHLFLTSVISCFTYYSASIALGVTYNYLHLIYILLFSACFFTLITAMQQISFTALRACVQNNLPLTGISVFLVFTGLALFGAWLPDIINALIAKRPLLLIENYTTEITYVLDMGIMAPLTFICIYNLKRSKMIGVVLLDMLLTICILMGIMLPIQTVFQIQSGIELPMAAILTKMGSFSLLALFALYFKIRSLQNIKEDVTNFNECSENT